jgi:glycosyltransferase involved in cell wall biosynthesis
VANSAYIARRIRKTWGREATVIYPPVTVAPRASGLPRQTHFLTAGRLVSYKNAAAVVEAFKLLPDQRLIVAGTGPDEKRMRAMAGPNVVFTGFVSDSEMRSLMATAKSLVFAAEEDFGIIPVEAQAEGTPVLALGRGGARETVVDQGPSPTGMFFDEPTAQDIAACINVFLAHEQSFTREACQQQARSFSADRFRAKFKAFVDQEMRQSIRSICEPDAMPAPDLIRAAE